MQIILLFLGVSVITTLIYTTILKMPLPELIDAVLHKQYSLYANVSYLFTPFLNYIYLSIWLGTAFFAFILLRPKLSRIQIFQLSGLLVFVLSLGVQTIYHVREFTKEADLVRDKTLHGRTMLSSKFSYPFSLYCKKYLPGKHSCALVTDQDLSDEKMMGNLVNLRYYLYPIDIFFNRQEPKDCIIVYGADEPLKHVPAGYKALPVFHDHHVLAIKETP